MELTKKENTFRGKTLEELKKLDIREFSKYLTSRQKRSVLRQFHEIDAFVNSARKKMEKNRPIRTHRREIVIVPEMVGMRIHIYNGRQFNPIDLKWNMLGHKFGEFSPTRARIKHGKTGVGATKGSKSKSKK
jgi:small subunit ribosomal protein S19